MRTSTHLIPEGIVLSTSCTWLNVKEWHPDICRFCHVMFFPAVLRAYETLSFLRANFLGVLWVRIYSESYQNLSYTTFLRKLISQNIPSFCGLILSCLRYLFNFFLWKSKCVKIIFLISKYVSFMTELEGGLREAVPGLHTFTIS